MFATFQACRERFFSPKRYAFFEKGVILLKTDIFSQYWPIFVKYLSIFVNVRTYLLYGTAYSTVLRTYLPVPYMRSWVSDVAYPGTFARGEAGTLTSDKVKNLSIE